MIDGIKILNNDVVQSGIILPVTDPSVFDEVPVGTLLISTSSNGLKIKNEGATDWEEFKTKGIYTGPTPPDDSLEFSLWLDTSV